MLRALHLAIRGREVHLEVSSTRSFVDKFREVSLSFVGGRRWHLHKSETNAKNLTRFYLPKVPLRPRNADAWLLRMADCLLFAIYEAVVAKEEESLHIHSRIVIMDACKLSSRRRVALPACAVLPTPGTVG